MKKLSLYIFLGLLLCNAGIAKEIIIHYSVDVYDRFKIEKLDDKNKVNFAIERVSQRLKEVISARGFTASIGKTTSEINSTFFLKISKLLIIKYKIENSFNSF